MKMKLNRKVVLLKGIEAPVGTVVETSRETLPSKGTVSVWIRFTDTFKIRADVAVSRLSALA